MNHPSKPSNKTVYSQWKSWRRQSGDCNKTNVQNDKITLLRQKTETTVCASSGMPYHVSQSLGETLTPYFKAVISSTVPYFRYLEMFAWSVRSCNFSISCQKNIFPLIAVFGFPKCVGSHRNLMNRRFLRFLWLPTHFGDPKTAFLPARGTCPDFESAGMTPRRSKWGVYLTIGKFPWETLLGTNTGV